MIRCHNCDHYDSHGAGNLCRGCYQFQRRHGRLSRPEERRPELRRHNTCRNCRQALAVCRGLCSACYQYQRYNNGRNRPRHLWREECGNCGRPKRGAPDWALGRCVACYHYLHHHGRERPRTLIERQAPHGWCECGRPAVERVRLPVNRHYEIYSLCENCMREEEKMNG